MAEALKHLGTGEESHPRNLGDIYIILYLICRDKGCLRFIIFPLFFLVFFYFPEILDEHEWVFNMNGGIKIIKTSWTLGLVTLKHDHYEGFFICLNHTEKKQPE